MNKTVGWIVTVLTALAGYAPNAAADPFVLGPPNDEGPAVVDASFQLRDLNAIDDEAETFEFSGVLELKWRDERQAFDPEDVGVEEKVFQGGYQFSEIATGWFPQVILVNESGLFEKHGVILRVRSDGTSTLIETINAVAEADFELRRYPFDRHQLDAVFEVLGADTSEVVLRSASAPATSSDHEFRTPQWTLTSVRTSAKKHPATHPGGGVASAFVVSVNVEREAFFVVRLIVIPLILIVMLSWSVFWMERSSLADRISVSFIGILTAVAYQIVVSEIQPHISYMTLMHGFLNLSLLVMCATVVINLVVGALDQKGKSDVGDLIDYRSRWAFPLVYFGLIGVMVAVAFTFF